MALVSVIPAHFASPWWLLLTLFVGANLLQSASTADSALWPRSRRVWVCAVAPLCGTDAATIGSRT
jgi:hypothetical protein